MGANLSGPDKVTVAFDTPQEIVVSQADDSILVYGQTSGLVNKPVRVDSNGVVQVNATMSAATQSSFKTGSKSSITTSAVQIIVSSTPAVVGVTVKAANTNTGTLYIGNATITAGTTDATDGFELAGGEAVTIEIDDVNKLYAIGSAAGQKLYWTAV